MSEDRPTNGRVDVAVMKNSLKDLRRDFDDLKAQVAGHQALAVQLATLTERVDAHGRTQRWVLAVAGSGAVGTLLLVLKLATA